MEWLKLNLPMLCDNILNLFTPDVVVHEGFKVDLAINQSYDRDQWSEHLNFQQSQTVRAIKVRIKELLNVQPAEFRNEMVFLLQLTKQNAEVWTPKPSQLQ